MRGLVQVTALAIAGMVLVSTSCMAVGTVSAAETPHVAFVHEFIRELGELEDFRAAAKVDLDRNVVDALTEGIHWSTRTQIVLRTDVAILSGMELNSPFNNLIPQIVDIDRQKIELHEKLIATATEFLSEPKPGVDYGKLAAEIPRVRAQLEALDGIMPKMSGLVFATLIDKSPDRDGHMSRLSIATSERQDLLRQLKTAFGQKLDQKGQDDLVNAGWILRGYLRKDKGYKCTDEV